MLNEVFMTQTALILIFSFVALAVGFFGGMFSKKSEIDSLKKQNQELENKNNEKSEKINELTAKLSENSARLETITELQKLIKEDFTKIAGQVIKEEQTDLRQQNRETLEEKLRPIKENFEKFKEKIEEFNQQGKINTTSIKTQIEALMNESSSIKTTANDLVNAIKTNSQARGEFGEIILENLLKQAGLVNKKDDAEKGNYITQETFRDINAPSERPRPDAVVFFPDNKHIIIDSKCPLNNFLEFANSNDEEVKANQLKLFYDSVKKMTEELSGKYNSLENLNTPEFKLMFIPLESCAGYIYAKSEILKLAADKDIIIVCPSTLLATLKIINRTWQQKVQSENIKELFQIAANIYDKFCTFKNNLEDIRTKFNSVSNSFEKAFSGIQGKGGLMSKIEKLKELGISTKNKIEEKYLSEKED